MSADSRLSKLESDVDSLEGPKRVDVRQEVRAIFLLVAPWVKDWEPVRDESDKVAAALETAVLYRLWQRRVFNKSIANLQQTILGVDTGSADYQVSSALREYFIQLARSPENEAHALQTLIAEREEAERAEEKRMDGPS